MPPVAPTVQGSPPTIEGASISGVFLSVCVFVELVLRELEAEGLNADAGLDADAALDPDDTPDPFDEELLLMMTRLEELLLPLLAAAPERLLLLLLLSADELLDEVPLPIGFP
jgi:hypothetical protein